jgi:glycine/D-amino acid oxidase-like deaminating enzyme
MINGLRVAVVGGGWYGCHLASSMIRAGAHVRLFERGADLFTGASAVNQNRLHMGFHYPRSYHTRKQIIGGHAEFLKTYPGLVSRIWRNIYAVAEQKSLLDFDTYAQIMAATGLPFKRIKLDRTSFRHIDGALLCDEQLLHTNQARGYFRDLLDGHLYLDTEVRRIEDNGSTVRVNGETYDYVLNCTWCTDLVENRMEMYFEPTIMLFYEGKQRDFALTLMDGDFFSIYPFEGNLVTLTAVRHTPLGQYARHDQAKQRIDRLAASEVATIRGSMESLARYYYPKFDDIFSYAGHAVSMKTKIASNTDARECVVLPKGRMITVFAGKIDTVFTAERMVMQLLSAQKRGVRAVAARASAFAP